MSTLETIKPFIKKAKDLEQHDPIMSYFCRYYAVQEGIKLREKNPDETSKRILLSLMDELEKQKDQVGKKVDDSQFGQEYVKNFCLKLFLHADDEDRSGNATKATAQKFFHAAQFMEVLKQFGDLPPDIVEKRKYSKWKALDITKAIKEGRKPTPGSLEEQEENQQSMEQNSFPDVPSYSSSSNAQQPSSSFPHEPTSFSNTATSSSSYEMPSNSPPWPTNISQPPSSSLGPPPSYPTSSSSTFNQPNFPSPPSYPSNSKPTDPPSYQGSNNPPSGKNLPGAVPTPFSSNHSSNSSSMTNTSKVSNHHPDVQKAEKYARYVISSLQFDDVPTAVKYLKMSLKELTGEELQL